MKTISYILIVVIIFMISCNNDSKNAINNFSTTLNDTFSNAPPLDTCGNLIKFIEGTLPYSVDSATLSDEKLNEEQMLNSMFVINILKNQIKAADNKVSDNYLTSYLHIDSCLKKMTEDEFNNTLDIGMMKTVLLYAGNYLFLQNGNIAYTWYIKFSTYDACPFYAGTIMFLTVFNKSGEQLSTITIGENTGGGDAPYYSSTDTYSVIDKDFVITIKNTQINGGDEENGKTICETTKSEFKFQVVPETGAINKISEKIGKPIKKYETL
jgi:hypothetical protein